MPTPVHATTKTGSRGELKAAVIFADIGWAPPVKLSEDIGTDLVTFARDTAAPDRPRFDGFQAQAAGLRRC